MNPNRAPIFVGNTVLQSPDHETTGAFVTLLGDTYYKIENYDGMAPFFMSIVSSSNHWLFISSSGGLSAGRVSAEQALFPYYTDDKITENHENTGGKSIFLITRVGRTSLWEPFSDRYKGSYQIKRNLYKNIAGTALIFEEENRDLGLVFRYAWRTSDIFGFVKTSWLTNAGNTDCNVEMLDGMQNILPANITSATQNIFSPLLDAYKRSEIDPETGLAIFALNSTLTDLAEPSESLLATTAFQVGLAHADYLVSSRQLDSFRAGAGIAPETEVRGQRCSYFIHAKLALSGNEEKTWHLVADVCQDSVAIVSLKNKLLGGGNNLTRAIEQDIQINQQNLEKIVATADGLQVSRDPLCTAHHFANVMFNVMRGGIFSNGYQIHTRDFIDFVATRNRPILTRHADFFEGLPAEMDILDLYAQANESRQADLIRLGYSYLPLSFSRRHGDPSRPWNRFAIDIKKHDGSPKLGYEGNWRDIFQNWEALAYSYPEYIEGMISTFLSATTVDGYNPYRITRFGIDWEIPEPNNPWANIGYWSDHQIIYLQRLMEISAKVHPGKLQEMLSSDIFSYANVPYRIKPYPELLANPYNTIDFNWDLESQIEARVKQTGTDGRLLLDRDGKVLHTNLTEKLLTLLLAKLVNFVPEGGIWMNTQRPEWNDANNALVGKGLSVVTLSYLRRMLAFAKTLLAQNKPLSMQISIEVHKLFVQAFQVLKDFSGNLAGTFTDETRRAMLDALGQAGSIARWDYYDNGLSGERTALQVSELTEFLDLMQQYIEHTLRINRRADNLYHAYNILHIKEGSASISYLYEMLEGQVSILSSGMLSGEESLTLLTSLRNSPLYRPDQHSYILYPDRHLPEFVARNTIRPEQVQGLELVAALDKANDRSLLARDENGNYHFNGNIHNIKNVVNALKALPVPLQELAQRDGEKIKALFEDVFRHNEFTGRSGTFFAYEGLGSIYWHMVSKLVLAVQETILRTRLETSTPALLKIYTDVRKGLSFNKTPAVYGAFPTDPYSHTPKGQGAKQPGMTGMVKEEILTRQVELGWIIDNGQLVFDILIMDAREFLEQPTQYTYFDLDGQLRQVELQPGSLAYSICQVPVVLTRSHKNGISVYYRNGTAEQIDGHVLGHAASRHIFKRDGAIDHLVVDCKSA